MRYTSYLQVIKDVDYMNMMTVEPRRDYDVYCEDDTVRHSDIRKLKKIFRQHIKEKFEASKNTDTSLGNFIKKHSLSLKEFICLLELLENDLKSSDFEKEAGITEERSDPFKRNLVRYESSNLKRHKLVFKITNPLRPMKIAYEVSYKAQLALKNRKYTDEYEQLDLALEEEAKRNSPDQLESLYYITSPTKKFKDLIITPELKDSLKTAMAREVNKKKILKEWGLGNAIDYGTGTTLNFRGPPGTGKTLAAHCLARELNKKILIVRYDQLQNCFVGQTEKHIQQVFKMAKIKDAVLFFDEADAVALSRSSLSQSWEMSQVNTLLKELERFEGVCIFATNFAEKYDEAFERRLTMHLDFTLPDNNQCIKILEKLLPQKARKKRMKLKNIELAGLSGGDIKNVVLNAGGIAAKEGATKISETHLQKAIKTVKEGKKETEKKETSYIR